VKSLAREALRISFGSGAALLVFLSAAWGGSATSAAAATVNPLTIAPQAQANWSFGRHLQLRSATFTNGSFLPQSTILNAAAPPFNSPTPGCAGGDMSPELSWTNVPRFTRSFVVMMFDVDASFTHWGIYNIPGSVTSLPENAGASGSPYGAQVYNDYGAGQEYDGPCPPPGLVHHYVITVYALATMLPPLPAPSGLGLLPDGETLFFALLEGRYVILDSASIVGLYSVPASSSTQSPNSRLQSRPKAN